MKRIFIVLHLILVGVLFSQNISGTVYELNEDSTKTPLPGVNVFWMGTTFGTTTDTDGNFELMHNESDHMLIISYVGFSPDTIHVEYGAEELELFLSGIKELDEIKVTARVKSTYISDLDVHGAQQVTKKELRKAACCTLSESFETNASVDVSYADAVTGAKQIQMLGLKGSYSQIMIENVPALRGLAAGFGLGYIPGPWMNSIQISKGTASVKNGFESITGQINIELEKADDTDKFYLDFFHTEHRKTDANMLFSEKLSESVSTSMLLHAEHFDNYFDNNGDSFTDMTGVKQFNVMNKWKYRGESPIVFHGFVSYLGENRTGGQRSVSDIVRPYSTEINTNRLVLQTKTGYLLPGEHGGSIAMINKLVTHKQEGTSGERNYNGENVSFYTNLLYDFELNPENKFSVGGSYQYDHISEEVDDLDYTINEHIPGVFAEYTSEPFSGFTAILGARADHHNTHGTFFTPRLHLKYSPEIDLTFRASAGMGYRTPGIFAENIGLLVSSRAIDLRDDSYWEKAWNAGINVLKYFYLGDREISVYLEYYRTEFVNQLVIDLDSDASSFIVSNLDGKSYSNSFLAEINFELLPRFDVNVAGRYNLVKVNTGGKLQEKPLMKAVKGLVNLSYASRLGLWLYDFTAQYNGKSRLPATIDDSDGYTPDFVIFNAQITRKFRYFEIYGGAENIGDFKQDRPIISADNPYNSRFDASNVWAPIMGRRVYAGIRFSIK